jgi:hypothetical protein
MRLGRDRAEQQSKRHTERRGAPLASAKKAAKR